MPDALPQEAARIIDRGFEAYHDAFRILTTRAAERFANQDWHAAAEDDRERLAIYEKHLRQTLRRIRDLFGSEIENRDRWAATRNAFAETHRGRPNAELAETFYNSITRRVFSTVGVDPYIEFVADGLTVPESQEAPISYWTEEAHSDTAALVADVLNHYELGVPFEDLDRDARRVADHVDACLERAGAAGIDQVEMLAPVFYRNKGAYLIGRIRSGKGLIPLVLPLLHAENGGLRVDTVLLTQNATSMVFSFTRSYFHVLARQPWALVRFLKTLMPLKRIAELYISLGFTKHGKTELYRDLCAYLADADERFEFARGTKGMVMAVFTLPGYDFVFKIIKDRFDPPKQTTRDEVMKKYRFVMLHDRVGRLADVQAYEHLEFSRDQFVPEVLEALLRVAARTVHVDGDSVVIDHLYTERRVTPLNLYLQDVERPAAVEAVIDCGEAIKDLAAADIFPGDMLVKNFGVTRHGRVIFYDYDELGTLGEFNFRVLPKPRDEFEMMSAEAWFYVAPGDVFPEEIGKFLGLTKDLNEVFHAYHSDLLDPVFWRRMQAKQKDQVLVDIFPYRQSKRFPLD